MQHIGQLLPAAMAPDKELAPSASTQLEPGVTDLTMALNQTRIRNSTPKHLAQALQYVFMLVGLKGDNLPSDLETDFIMAFAQRHYGNHTPAEVRLAFDLAITRQLPLQERDISCYQSFSVEYFARIMGAYRSWAAERMLRLPVQIPEPVPPTKEQLLDINIGYCHAKLQWLIRNLKLPLKAWPHITSSKTA